MIGSRLKQLRKSKGMTQKELAEALGSSQSFVSSLEKDTQSPGSEILISLKRFFGIGIDWLLTGEETASTESRPQSQTSDAPELTELLDEARKVLTSGNSAVFDALALNIRYFSHAIDVEKRVKGMEADLAEMKSYIKEMKQQKQEGDENCQGEPSSK